MQQLTPAQLKALGAEVEKQNRITRHVEGLRRNPHSAHHAGILRALGVHPDSIAAMQHAGAATIDLRTGAASLPPLPARQRNPKPRLGAHPQIEGRKPH
jgi:hypothetical protein